MSGYDPRTGWTHFTSTKVSRYHRRVDGQPDELDERLAATGLDSFWDAAGGLHVRCDDGRLWEILSGQPATFSSATPKDPKNETEWLTATDVGAALADPPLPPATVLRLLREAGFLQRSDGRDVVTKKADGLFEERSLGDNWSSRFNEKGKAAAEAVQRRSAFKVVEELQAKLGDSGKKQDG